MAKKKKRSKIKSLRGYATTSVQSKSKELGIKSVQEQERERLEEKQKQKQKQKQKLQQKQEQEQEDAEKQQGRKNDGDLENMASAGSANENALVMINSAKRTMGKKKAKVKKASLTDPMIELNKKAEDTARGILVETNVIKEDWKDSELDLEMKQRIAESLQKMDKQEISKLILETVLRLEEYGFQQDQVKDAIRQNGPWVKGCLEWLLLHLDESELPRGWGRISNIVETDTENILEVQTSKASPTGSKEKEDLKSKDLQNEEEDMEDKALKKKQENERQQELERKQEKERLLMLVAQQQAAEEEQDELLQMSPIEKLKTLDKKLVELLEQARNEEEKKKKREISNAIRIAKLDIQDLIKEYPELNEETLAHRNEKKTSLNDKETQKLSSNRQEEQEEEEEEEEGSLFNMFDETNHASTKSADSAAEHNHNQVQMVEIKLHEHGNQTKHKLNPSTLLADHVKKEFGKTSVVKYEIENLNYGRYQATASFKDWTCSMDPNEYCKDKTCAKDYAALKLLFEIAGERKYHLQMNKICQRIFADWKVAKERAAEEKEARENQRLLSTVEEISELISFKNNGCSKSRSYDQEEDQKNTKGSLVNSKSKTGNGNDENSAGEVALSSRGKTINRLDKDGKDIIAPLLDNRQFPDIPHLPVMNVNDEIVTGMETSDILILASSTGSGKTTQVPKILLLDQAKKGNGRKTNIIVTEPRQISAISVAQRVSFELGDPEEFGSKDCLVGYQIRNDKMISKSCRLRFVTTGILLRQLRSDPLLSNYSHVVCDEVHERTLDGDLLITILRNLVKTRREMGDPLKVVLMSATIDLDKLRTYFTSDDGVQPPVVEAEGRTFPVESFPLEETMQISQHVGDFVAEATSYNNSYERDVEWLDPEIFESRTIETMRIFDETRVNLDLIISLLLLLVSPSSALNQVKSDNPIYAKYKEAISKTKSNEGAILVFLPGMYQIQALFAQLSNHPVFSNSSKFVLLRLHSNLVNKKEQRLVFEKPRHGARKIVLSTNVAETGVTIPDVTVVIDSGKVKEMTFRPKTKMDSLQEVFTSKASLMQRAGRAGRVAPGICFQLLSSSLQSRLRDFSLPEMQRVALEGVVLHLMTMGQDPWKFLSQSLDPPALKSIDAAVTNLEQAGACEQTEHDLDNGDQKEQQQHKQQQQQQQQIECSISLTHLGSHMARMPLHYKLSKLLLLGALMRCLDPILTIVASIGEDSKLFQDGSATKVTQNKFSSQISDHLSIWNIFREWEKEMNRNSKAGNSFCAKYSLSRNALSKIKRSKTELFENLKDAGFIPHQVASCKFPALNRHSASESVLCSVLFAGFQDVAEPTVSSSNSSFSASSSIQYRCKGNELVTIAKDCVNRNMLAPNVEYNGANGKTTRKGLLTFLTKMKTGKNKNPTLYDSTFFPPSALILFSSVADVEIFPSEKTVIVGRDWSVKISPRAAQILLSLRKVLIDLLDQAFLDPENAMKNSSVQNIVDAIAGLLHF